MLTKPRPMNPMLAGDDVRMLHSDSDLSIGCANDLFIILFTDRTTVQGVQCIANAFEEYSKGRSGCDVAVITIIERRAKMPSPGSREALAQVLKDISSHVMISGVAFEGDGFVAASIRGVVVGLTLMARQPYPHRVLKNVFEVSRWIESEYGSIGKRFNGRAIERAVSTFRDRVARLGVQRSGTHPI
jgi:hypothetical protein